MSSQELLQFTERIKTNKERVFGVIDCNEESSSSSSEEEKEKEKEKEKKKKKKKEKEKKEETRPEIVEKGAVKEEEESAAQIMKGKD